jgi:DNA-binding CsgD family transcriptional regulator
VLRGRSSQCASLDRLLGDVRGGRSAPLVIRGEPGVGKSALLRYVVDAAHDFRVEQATGVESEMELPFAGLHQLCIPMLDRLEHLPEPQRDALRTAFGMSAGGPHDRFLVGLAVLTLFADAGDRRPLLCVVDDAQWLDRASLETLAFVARRLLADSVALVFATRDSLDDPADPLAGLPEIRLGGLRSTDARALLASVLHGPLDEHVRDRIVAETHGNPLALLELSRGLLGGELAGGFAMPNEPLSSRIETSYRERLRELPAESRRLLLTAAADPVGDAGLLWRAAAALGIGPEAAAPAAEAGLVTISGRVTFSHPLVRSAVYHSASSSEQRAAHRALAEATDPEADPDRRSWHLAQAAARPDDEVAGELERSADRARARGGLAAVAAFLQRAALLTADPSRRAERALQAAQASLDAGAADAAIQLLGIAELGPLDQLQRARVERLHARLAFVQRRGGDAPPLLLRAARRLEPLEPALAHETYLEAVLAALTTGRPDSLSESLAGLRGLPLSRPPSPPELLVTGQALLLTDGPETAIPVLQQALRDFTEDPGVEDVQELTLATYVALRVWDDESFLVLSTRNVELTRQAGAMALLPQALEVHAVSRTDGGDFDAAQALLQEADLIADAVDAAPIADGWLLLAGWRGDEAEALERIEHGIRDATARGEESTITIAELSRALVFNGLGRHEEAFLAGQRSCDHHPAKAYARALVEMVEAAARSGRVEEGRSALEQLSKGTRAAGTDWARGLESRSSALLSEGEPAERAYVEAIERLGRTRIRTELARSHLLYGEWLRRQRRRVDARAQLRTASDMFTEMGAHAFADRAARELLATGETARKRSVETHLELTPQEAHVTRLAREGLTNPEIAARMFISPRTVEYHLHKVFAKLGVTSRGQLEHALSEQGPYAAQLS